MGDPACATLLGAPPSPSSSLAAVRPPSLLRRRGASSPPQVYSWVYLLESSLVSMFTVISARCFASMLPSPMPGKLAYFTQWCGRPEALATAVALIPTRAERSPKLTCLLVGAERDGASVAAPQPPTAPHRW